jgi:hypothetical protein
MFDSPRNAGSPLALAPLPSSYHPQAHLPPNRDTPQAYNQYIPPQYRMAQPVSHVPATPVG